MMNIYQIICSIILSILFIIISAYKNYRKQNNLQLNDFKKHPYIFSVCFLLFVILFIHIIYFKWIYMYFYCLFYSPFIIVTMINIYYGIKTGKSLYIDIISKLLSKMNKS